MSEKTLLVVDGYSLLFRAFYATRFLSTADGRPTNALYGFTGMVFSLIDQYSPDCILVALDAHAPTFRHEEYAEYKGTRKETPNELVQQLIYSRELIRALGLPLIEKEGFEADDVVGTISFRAEQAGYRTIIVSGDMDAAQLVDPYVTLITPKSGVAEVAVYNPEAVVARYGFGPELIPDYKALVGDTSDNIPGVPGIGEKSASILIQRFGPVENIVAHLHEIEEKYRKKLEPSLEQIPKSKRLATIIRDAPIEFDFAPLQTTEEGLATAEAMLTSLEFKHHVKKLPQILGRYIAGAASAKAVVNMREAVLEPKIGAKLTDYSAAREWMNGVPFGVFFTAPAAPTNLLDEGTEGSSWVAIGPDVRELPFDAAKELVLKHPELAIGHDLKPLYRGSAQMAPPRFDTMLACYVLQSGRSGYALRDVIQGYLDVVSPAEPAQMAMGLSMLEPVMRDRLNLENQSRVLDEMELPLIPVLAEMESLGVRVSREFLNDFSAFLEVEIEQIKQKIFEISGHEFLIASPKQLGEVLFEKMQIPGGKKGKTGWSTGAEILQEIDHPIAAEIIAWRELSKLKSTYSDSLPKMIREDGRIHTTLNQTVAATGRLSSQDPNLQNIPIRTELGRKIRRAFIAKDGFDLVSFDYSQIELRLLAHLCNDEKLVEAFQKRVDVHTVTASLMFLEAEESVSKEHRRLAKMLNYAVLYGVTDFGLAQQLGEGFGVSEARVLIQDYFERFPKIKSYTESIVEEARAKGFTSTLMGRRRYFPDIHAANRAERLYAERQAMNAPIQGAAADLAKLAMIHVRKYLNAGDVEMLLQVHDELLFEVPKGEENKLQPIQSLMENAMPISVPIEVDAKWGENWCDMTPLTF